MNSFYYPLASFQEFYVLLFLSQKFDIEIEFDNLTKIFNQTFKKGYDSDILKLGVYIYQLS